MKQIFWYFKICVHHYARKSYFQEFEDFQLKSFYATVFLKNISNSTFKIKIISCLVCWLLIMLSCFFQVLQSAKEQIKWSLLKWSSHVMWHFFLLQCYCTGTVPPDMEIRFSKQGLNIKCINCVVINSESDSAITEGRLLQEN